MAEVKNQKLRLTEFLSKNYFNPGSRIFLEDSKFRDDKL
jgi:hypothetical protein